MLYDGNDVLFHGVSLFLIFAQEDIQFERVERMMIQLKAVVKLCANLW